MERTNNEIINKLKEEIRGLDRFIKDLEDALTDTSFSIEQRRGIEAKKFRAQETKEALEQKLQLELYAPGQFPNYKSNPFPNSTARGAYLDKLAGEKAKYTGKNQHEKMQKNAKVPLKQRIANLSPKGKQTLKLVLIAALTLGTALAIGKIADVIHTNDSTDDDTKIETKTSEIETKTSGNYAEEFGNQDFQEKIIGLVNSQLYASVKEKINEENPNTNIGSYSIEQIANGEDVISYNNNNGEIEVAKTTPAIIEFNNILQALKSNVQNFSLQDSPQAEGKMISDSICEFLTCCYDNGIDISSMCEKYGLNLMDLSKAAFNTSGKENPFVFDKDGKLLGRTVFEPTSEPTIDRDDGR